MESLLSTAEWVNLVYGHFAGLRARPSVRRLRLSLGITVFEPTACFQQRLELEGCLFLALTSRGMHGVG
jgi:hypothetical protein